MDVNDGSIVDKEKEREHSWEEQRWILWSNGICIDNGDNHE